MKHYSFFLLILCSLRLPAKPLNVQMRSDLNFGNVFAGSSNHVIVADTRETTENASFLVTGDKNRSFTILLPNSAVLSFAGGGGYNISVTNFTSNPVGTGSTGNNGRETVFIGATIPSVPFTVPAGSYTGSYVVEVIY